ncbi:type II toxin-antitoxin system HicA family toxin [bacterium]|nr:type II toxin-antitoxin system HicA family toxin [bacterium]
MASYTDRVKEILRNHNCRFDRPGKGDHEIWNSPINGRKFPVDHSIKSRHTANGILKQAGIKDVKIP